MKRETKECRRHDAELQKGTMEQEQPEVIIDHKVTLLAAAGAAMATECRPCLNDIMPELEEAGVSEADIRWAMQNGQFSGVHADLSMFALLQIYEAERSRKSVR